MDLQFGQFRLRPRERQLAGPDGSVELSARSFDILQVLLGRPNEVIGKESLFEAAWPGLVVEDNTLQVHISALRKALGGDLIATVHGRGYKYAGPAPVSVPAAAAPAAEPSHSPQRPVVVVLPFDNLSGDPDQQYFSDGITGDIIDRLSRFWTLAVIGQHSATAFRSAAPDFAAIRAKLMAGFVVTGSIRRSGDRIRIAVRLSDTGNGETIWAEHYDRPITDIFSLQDEISALVAASLARRLEIEINMRNAVRAPASLSSYEHMLQGYWHFKKLTRPGNVAARACFERAIAADPRNAEAMAWLGVSYCEDWVHDFSEDNARRGAELCAQAVDLNPGHAVIRAVQTWALLCVGDRPAALQASERSMAFNAGEPGVLVNRALALAYDGKLRDAAELLELAHRLEPVPPLWFGEFRGVLSFSEGRYADTLAGVERLSEHAWDAMYALASYGHLGERDRARDLLARIRARGPEPPWDLGLAREPYRDREVWERLQRGLRLALEF